MKAEDPQEVWLPGSTALKFLMSFNAAGSQTVGQTVCAVVLHRRIDIGPCRSGAFLGVFGVIHCGGHGVAMRQSGSLWNSDEQAMNPPSIQTDAADFGTVCNSGGAPRAGFAALRQDATREAKAHCQHSARMPAVKNFRAADDIGMGEQVSDVVQPVAAAIDRRRDPEGRSFAPCPSCCAAGRRRPRSAGGA